MYILVLILPLLSSILAGLYGRYFGREGCAFLSTFILFLTWLLSLFIFYEVGVCHNIVDIILYQWFMVDII
jgi:NADH:ubiquinone oxidoreductase subunit 5 (subunit L)/multisubunit Na+/H+ antiporter MnhA subunit